MKRKFRILSVVLGAAVLSGCASLPETSRSAASVMIPQPGSITALQRKFQAETPYVVNFGFDEDTLDAEALARLDQQADWILDHPHVKFRVYGHTDRVGNVAYNADLGLRRANRVVDYLVGKGIERARLEAVVSFGEESPLIDTEERERLNRRAVTEVWEYFLPAPAGAVATGGRVSAIISVPETTPTTVSSPGPSPEPASPEPDSSPEPDTTSEPDSSPEPDTTSEPDSGGSKGGGSKANSGRGNGDEGGDPGKSEGKNNGGDE